jgi:isopropylmalate/homocitrate/citramalate synthase
MNNIDLVTLLFQLETLEKECEVTQEKITEVRKYLESITQSPVEVHGGKPCVGCVADRLTIRLILENLKE